MIESIVQDLRHGARMLVKNPGFTLIAIASIAIGVGANAAMFSLADGLVLRPLPVPRADQVVSVSATAPRANETFFLTNNRLSYLDYVDLRDRAQSFAGLAAYTVTLRELRDGARPGRAEQARARRQRQLLRRARTPTGARSRHSSRRGPCAWKRRRRRARVRARGPSSSDPIRASSGGRSASVVSTSPSSASRRQSFTGMHLVLPPAFIIPIAMSVEARRRCRPPRFSNSATSAISRFGGG